MKNPGQTYEILEGTYKGKFFDVRNKDQQDQFLKQNKLVGKVCEDTLGMKSIKDKVIIHISKLKQIGWID